MAEQQANSSNKSGREIKTGYGTRRPEKSMGLDYYKALAIQAGFSVKGEADEGLIIFLELHKE